MSTLKANIITAVGGGGSTVKVNNDSTYISDGGAVTDHNLVQGVGKVWASFDGSGSGFLDSFNCGSLTDHGTGDHVVNYTNAMSNDDYAHPFHFGGTSGVAMIRTGGRGVNTGNISMVGTNADQSSAQDVTASGVAVLGDLA